MPNSDPLSAESLKKRFVGNLVTITHRGNGSPKNKVGICKAVVDTTGGITIELDDGSMWPLVPDKQTDDGVEGNFGGFGNKRRKVELADSPCVSA